MIFIFPFLHMFLSMDTSVEFISFKDHILLLKSTLECLIDAPPPRSPAAN